MFSLLFEKNWLFHGASLVAQSIKKPPAMQETWVLSLGGEDPLEKGMATHFSILACRIPWTEKPAELQSMGLQRVRHNWAANTFACSQPSLLPLKTCLSLLLGYCFYSSWSYGLLWKCISFYIFSCSDFRPLSPKYFIWNCLLIWTTV